MCIIEAIAETNMVDSLPSRPLQRSEIEQLENSGSLDGVFPVYDERGGDLAYAAVLANNGTLSAIAISENGDWNVVEKADVGNTDNGLHMSDADILQELQDLAARSIGHSSTSK